MSKKVFLNRIKIEASEMNVSETTVSEATTVPSDTPTHSATGSFDEKKNNDEEEDIDFEDLMRRLEALKNVASEATASKATVSEATASEATVVESTASRLEFLKGIDEIKKLNAEAGLRTI